MKISDYMTVAKIRVSVSQPRAMALSKKARKDAAEKNNVSENQITVSQRLMADCQLRKDIGTLAPKIKAAIMPFTSALVNGEHWIPIRHFASVQSLLDTMVAEYNLLLSKFADNLDDLIEADRAAKGDLFDPDAYESADEIRAKKASWTFDVDNHDRKFDALFDDATLESELKKQWEKQQTERFKDSDQQLKDRIIAETIKDCDKLTKSILCKISNWEIKEASGKRSALHTDTMRKQLLSAVELGKLSLSQCPAISKTCKNLVSLEQVTYWDGLKDDRIRTEFKAKLKQALSPISGSAIVQAKPVTQPSPQPIVDIDLSAMAPTQQPTQLELCEVDF